ncbi:MAG: 2-C-methyl-D-erythritol 4-phosphate cytidylyltransferase, partial [Chloroflexota bacterium]
MARASAVVVAAGKGTRLGDPAKTMLPLAGRPMLAWSLDNLEQAEEISEVVIVVGDHTRAAVEALVADHRWPKVRAVVVGGERRQDSVLAGLRATDPNADVVAIHDGARPLAPAALFDAADRAARADGAAIAAAPVADTLKRVVDLTVTATVDRTGLWGAQTPQALRRDLLLDLFHRVGDRDVTDEASLCEAMGVPVTIVPSDATNLKVTHPGDLLIAEALLHQRTGGTRYPRTGIGYDVHRFAEGRRLVLGGVEIPHTHGLEGHSDADVVLHAVSDALLGAAALGDIGQHFPPGDPRFKDADSRDLLRECVRLLHLA